MGTHKSFKEALISALISADLPQNLPNFCSESAPGRAQGKSNESPKTPRQLLKRIPSAHIQPLRSPRGSLKHPKISPKNFHQFMGTSIKGTVRGRKQALPAVQKLEKEYPPPTQSTPCKELTMQPLARPALAPTKPSKRCPVKQIPQRVHLNENIHSREYNKPACQMRIFLSVQVNTEL